MGTHIEKHDDVHSRAQAKCDRSRNRAKTAVTAAHETPRRLIAPDPLTPKEAELAAQLSAALEYAPSRHSPKPVLTRQPDIDSMIEAPLMRDIDDVTLSPRRARRQLLPDDAEGADSVPQLKAPAWLAGTKRTSWQERLSAVMAWTMTLCVIIGVIGGVGVAMLGLERALALLTMAARELSTLVASVSAVWQNLMH
jgi:hypothetical protein